MGTVDGTGQPVGSDFNGRDAVEPQEGQIRQVIVIQRFRIQVGVHQTEAAEAISTTPVNVGQEKRPRVPHYCRRDPSPSVNQQTDLAVELSGQFRNGPGQLGGNQLIGGHLAFGEFFELFGLEGLEARCVTA